MIVTRHSRALKAIRQLTQTLQNSMLQNDTDGVISLNEKPLPSTSKQ